MPPLCPGFGPQSTCAWSGNNFRFWTQNGRRPFLRIIEPSGPCKATSGKLRLIEKFELDAVRHRPTLLTELDDLSLALKRMSNGLSAFARFMPVDVVRPPS